jgi:hypothetical protein
MYRELRGEKCHKSTGARKLKGSQVLKVPQVGVERNSRATVSLSRLKKAQIRVAWRNGAEAGESSNAWSLLLQHIPLQLRALFAHNLFFRRAKIPVLICRASHLNVLVSRWGRHLRDMDSRKRVAMVLGLDGCGRGGLGRVGAAQSREVRANLAMQQRYGAVEGGVCHAGIFALLDPILDIEVGTLIELDVDHLDAVEEGLVVYHIVVLARVRDVRYGAASGILVHRAGCWRLDTRLMSCVSRVLVLWLVVVRKVNHLSLRGRHLRRGSRLLALLVRVLSIFFSSLLLCSHFLLPVIHLGNELNDGRS